MAGMGPRPMTAGSTPATAVATTRAIGLRPSSRAQPPASTSTQAPAPSLMPELLPAVTDAALAEGGLEARQGLEAGVGARVLVAVDDDRLALRLGHRHRHDLVGEATGLDGRHGALLRDEREGVLVLAADRPAARPRSRRSRPSSRGGASRPGAGWRSASRGSCRPSRACRARRAPPALAMTYGARVIDSTPPATKTSPSPTMIAWAAALIACRPEPHSRLTVWPATSTGSPASSAAMRATLRLSSPAWLAQPRMTSSMRGRVDADSCSTAALMTSAARSSGRTARRAPP